MAGFQGLEFLLRGFLYKKGDSPHGELKKGEDLNKLVVGDSRPENAMTCFDPLGKLISRYNTYFTGDQRVDSGLVATRNALAHGRVFGKDQKGWFHLLKFSESDKAGVVRVEFSEEMNEDWFKKQGDKIKVEYNKVLRVFEAEPE